MDRSPLEAPREMSTGRPQARSTPLMMGTLASITLASRCGTPGRGQGAAGAARQGEAAKGDLTAERAQQHQEGSTTNSCARTRWVRGAASGGSPPRFWRP